MRSTPPGFRDLTRDPLWGKRHGNATEGLVGAMLAVLVLLAVLAVAQAVRKDEEPAAVTGDCGTVSDDPVSAERAHREGSVVYDTAPPSSGDHSPVPLSPSEVLIARPAPADVVERAVHNLERGYVVIFYGQDVSDDVRKVVDVAGSGQLPKVIVVPWDRGPFDVGTTRFVLTAWGHRLPCDDPSARSIVRFVQRYGGSSGTAPKKDAP